MGNVSTFSALSACCQFDNADITVTGDITFTDQLTITGRTVSITSTKDAVLTSDRSFSASSGGMLFIEDGAKVALTGLHFVDGSATSVGGCLYVDNSDLAVFNSSFTGCFSAVGGAYTGVGCRSRRSNTHHTRDDDSIVNTNRMQSESSSIPHNCHTNHNFEVTILHVGVGN